MQSLESLNSILSEMGYSTFDIERAYIAGHKTIESIVEFISGEANPVECDNPRYRLVLRNSSRQSQSMFNPQSVVVNLSDVSRSSAEMPNSCGPMGQDVQPHVDTSNAEERLAFEQRISREVAEALRKEKIEKQQELERIRAQIAADRQEKAQSSATSCIAAPSTTLAASNNENAEQFESNNLMKVKIIWFDQNCGPFHISLHPSASYADLMEKIQQFLVAHPPPRNVSLVNILPASDITLRALDQHLLEINATDPCVRLVLRAWPHHTDLPKFDQSKVQRLTDLKITNGVTIAIQHVHCEFQSNVIEQVNQLLELRPRTAPELLPGYSPAPSQPEPGFIGPPEERAPEDSDDDYPMPPLWVDENSEDHTRFPGQGQSLHPRPPGDALPVTSLHVRETVRRAALNLAQMLRTRSEPTQSELVSEPIWNEVPTLLLLCLRKVLCSIMQYEEDLRATQQGAVFDPAPHAAVGARAKALTTHLTDQTAFHQRHMGRSAVHYLFAVPWPEELGNKLIQALINENLFTAHTAAFLPNCVSALNLKHCALVTTELVQALVTHWSELVQLYLDSCDPLQITKTGICALNNLKNLRTLSVSRLHTVNDETIRYLVELPRLQELNLSYTKVSDDGWTNLRSVTHSVAPLIKLDLGGLGVLLTDTGLCAIVQLFPKLQLLDISGSHVVGLDSDASAKPLQELVELDVSGCSLLRILPRILLPSPSNPSTTLGCSGLRTLRFRSCAELDLSQLLAQLNGHPLSKVDDFTQMHSLNSTLLKQLFTSSFPLSEVSIASLHAPWFLNDPDLLVFILFNLPTVTLTRLALPIHPLSYPPNPDVQTRVCDGIRLLGRCTQLVDLDLGAQITGEPQFGALLTALRHLTHLRRLVAINIPSELEAELHQACPYECKIRLQRHPQRPT